MLERLRIVSDDDRSFDSRFLTLYPKDKQYVTSVRRTLEGYHFLVRKFDHPFQVPQPAHLSREHAIVYVSQALCIAGGLWLEEQSTPPFTPDYYISALSSERAAIRSFELKYTKFARLTQQIDLNLCLTASSITRRYASFDCRFEFPAGILGNVKTVISLSTSLDKNIEAFS